MSRHERSDPRLHLRRKTNPFNAQLHVVALRFRPLLGPFPLVTAGAVRLSAAWLFLQRLVYPRSARFSVQGVRWKGSIPSPSYASPSPWQHLANSRKAPRCQPGDHRRQKPGANLVELFIMTTDESEAHDPSPSVAHGVERSFWDAS